MPRRALKNKMSNPQLIQWKEFNSTIKQRINTLYSVRLNPAQVMRFCAYLKSMKYYPSQNTIDDETIREQYDIWRQLTSQGQTEYLNVVATRNQAERASRIGFVSREDSDDESDEDEDEDPTNVMN